MENSTGRKTTQCTIRICFNVKFSNAKIPHLVPHLPCLPRFLRVLQCDLLHHHLYPSPPRRYCYPAKVHHKFKCALIECQCCFRMRWLWVVLLHTPAAVLVNGLYRHRLYDLTRKKRQWSKTQWVFPQCGPDKGNPPEKIGTLWPLKAGAVSVMAQTQCPDYWGSSYCPLPAQQSYKVNNKSVNN